MVESSCSVKIWFMPKSAEQNVLTSLKNAKELQKTLIEYVAKFNSDKLNGPDETAPCLSI